MSMTPTSVLGSATTAAMVSAISSVLSESVVQQLERVMTCCEEEARARAAPHSHLLCHHNYLVSYQYSDLTNCS